MSTSLTLTRPRQAILVALILIPLLALALVAGVLAAPTESAIGPANGVDPVLYVKPGAGGGCTSWADACELQTALGAAVSGQQIWVAEGLYKPTAGADRTINFVLKQGVAIFGGFAGDELDGSQRDWVNQVTVLSGDIDNNDTLDGNGIIADPSGINGSNSYHVLTGNGVTETAQLDGFTITGGYADGTWPNNSGGGLFAGNGSPKLANLVFQGNYAGDGGGGGIRVDGGSPDLLNVSFVANESPLDGGGFFIGFGSDPTLTQVTFLNNKGLGGGGVFMIGDSEASFDQVNFIGNLASRGAGLFSRLSSPRLSQVLFQDNHSAEYGGGMAITLEGTPRLSDVTFVGNSATINGGGLYNAINSTPVLTRTTFISNSSTYGGGLQQQAGATITMTNSTFNGNSASQFGGAIRFVEAATVATLNNVTFSANRAASQGGAIYNSAASVTINNSTFSANAADIGGALANAGGGKPVLHNLVMWGNTATTSAPQILASSPVTVSYGLIEGGCAVNCSGTILDQNPMFQRNPSDGGDGWGAGDNDDYGDLRIKRSSPAENAGDDSLVPGNLTTDHDGAVRIVGAAVDLGAFEIPATLSRYYVDQTVQQPADGSEWAKAFPSLQTALIYAQSGTDIWVADGHYRPGFSRQDAFRLLPDVVVYGGFEGIESDLNARVWDDFITVLTGDIFGDDQTDNDGIITDTANIKGINNYHVTWGAGANQAARLDGFLITGGYADSTWPHNSGSGMFVGNGNPTLANLLFQGNFAGSGGGGGMRMDGGSPDMSDITFIGNRTSIYGGGLYVGPGSQPTLTNSVFISNDAPIGSGGGVYMLNSGQATFNDVTFANNHSFHDGAAMFLYGSNPRLNGVIFENNKADRDGGAIAMFVASSPVMTDTTFIHNQGRNGGAMAIYGGSTPSLAGVTFEDNQSTKHGGAMAIYDGSTPLMTGVTFEDNHSTEHGGGIYSVASHPVLIDVIFDSNQTAVGYFGGGGMFSLNNSYPRLTRVNFIHNRAGGWGGGGMANDSGTHPVLTDTTFISNTAAAYGGGLANWNGSTMTMTRALFRDNSVDTADGGGMFIGLNSHGSLVDVILEGNSAPGAGGGLFIQTNSNPLLANVLFTINSANYGGGMYLYEDSNPNIINTTFSGNVATNYGGGLANQLNSYPIIQNSIFYSNTAPLGAQVYNLDTSTPTFAYSLVQGSGGSGSWVGPGTDLGGNIDDDPLFVRNTVPGTGDYGDLHLTAHSPAVDAGDYAFVPPGLTTDLDGNPRIYGPAVDMGAYEFYLQFLYLPVILK